MGEIEPEIAKYPKCMNDFCSRPRRARPDTVLDMRSVLFIVALPLRVNGTSTQLSFDRVGILQGDLAHKKQPHPLKPP